MNAFRPESGIVRSVRKCSVMSLGAMGFSSKIRPQRERERKPKRGFQVLSGLEEKHSATSRLTRLIFRRIFRSVFFLAEHRLRLSKPSAKFWRFLILEVIPIKFFERFRRDWDFRHTVIQTATIVVLFLTCIVQIVCLALCS